MSPRPLHIVGLGGATASPSSPERALTIALAAAKRRGAQVRLFGGDFLRRLPHYDPLQAARTPEEDALLAAVRGADGLVIATPGYHGTVSGLLKNALDLLEETGRDERPYLTGLPVGLIATAYGWQATGGAIAALRAITHALRGWPTPYAAAINSTVTPFEAGGAAPPAVTAQLELVSEQVLAFAETQRRAAA